VEGASAARTSAREPGRGALAWLRAVARALIICVVTLALAQLWFAGFAVAWPGSRRWPRWRGFLFRTWSRSVLACAGVRLVVRGRPPSQASFLVANHLSYVDIPVLASQASPVFVSMAEVRGWPFFGVMASSIGTVFIERGQKRSIPGVNAQMESWLDRGFTVVLFPEGTNSHGERVYPFRPSLLEPAARSRHPVAWAVIGYRTGERDEPASRSVCWAREPLHVHVFRLLRNERIEAWLTFGDDLVHGGDRKALARDLQAKVESAFEPVE
jgi:1-acyl-sn-glycerol-3-phosphate acyltransferase